MALWIDPAKLRDLALKSTTGAKLNELLSPHMAPGQNTQFCANTIPSMCNGGVISAPAPGHLLLSSSCMTRFHDLARRRN